MPGLSENHGPVTDHIDWGSVVVAGHTRVGDAGTDTQMKGAGAQMDEPEA